MTELVAYGEKLCRLAARAYFGYSGVKIAALYVFMPTGRTALDDEVSKHRDCFK